MAKPILDVAQGKYTTGHSIRFHLLPGDKPPQEVFAIVSLFHLPINGGAHVLHGQLFADIAGDVPIDFNLKETGTYTLNVVAVHTSDIPRDANTRVDSSLLTAIATSFVVT
jgi:hypothetical protein